MSDDRLDVQAVISQFMFSLTASVVASGRSIARDVPELVIEKPEGFTLAIDVV